MFDSITAAQGSTLFVVAPKLSYVKARSTIKIADASLPAVMLPNLKLAFGSNTYHQILSKAALANQCSTGIGHAVGVMLLRLTKGCCQ